MSKAIHWFPLSTVGIWFNCIKRNAIIKIPFFFFFFLFIITEGQPILNSWLDTAPKPCNTGHCGWISRIFYHQTAKQSMRHSSQFAGAQSIGNNNKKKDIYLKARIMLQGLVQGLQPKSKPCQIITKGTIELKDMRGNREWGGHWQRISLLEHDFFFFFKDLVYNSAWHIEEFDYYITKLILWFDNKSIKIYCIVS